MSQILNWDRKGESLLTIFSVLGRAEHGLSRPLSIQAPTTTIFPMVFRFFTTIFISITLFIPTTLMASPYQRVWDDLLQRYVSQTQVKGIDTTLVDYEQFGQSPSFLALVRYLEQAKIPEDKDASLSFWIDVYHMAVVKAATAYPRLQTPGPEFYNTAVVNVSGIPMSLTQIKNTIAKFTDTPVSLFLTDGTLGSPNFPTKSSQNTSAETYCQKLVTEMLKNSGKSIRTDGNTRTLYTSQYIVNALGENWRKDLHIQDILKDINPDEYSVRILPYDNTINRRIR